MNNKFSTFATKLAKHAGKEVTKARMLTLFSSLVLLLSGIFATFAWFRSVNNGEIHPEIPTVINDGIVLAFTPFSELEGVLMPAQMREGVINNTKNESSYTSGTIDKITIPTGNGVFPLTSAVKDEEDNILYYKYDVNASDFNNLVPNNQYLKYPATSLYRQFSMNVGSTNTAVKSRNAIFSIALQYSDVEGKFHNLTQEDAFGVRFYLIDTKLDSKQLSSVSTDRFQSSLKSKEFMTISELMYKHETAKIYPVTQSGSDFTVGKAERFSCGVSTDKDAAERYAIIPTINKGADGSFTLDFKLYNLAIETSYYLVINLYYNLPDELLTGDLLLTSQIVLNISYNLENVVSR